MQQTRQRSRGRPDNSGGDSGPSKPANRTRNKLASTCEGNTDPMAREKIRFGSEDLYGAAGQKIDMAIYQTQPNLATAPFQAEPDGGTTMMVNEPNANIAPK